MRVYGALMWSLGKVLDTPEVTRVYIGSFREDAYNRRGRENADLFDSERQDLLADLRMLPRSSVIRKINDLVKRARLVKVHVSCTGRASSVTNSIRTDLTQMIVVRTGAYRGAFAGADARHVRRRREEGGAAEHPAGGLQAGDNHDQFEFQLGLCKLIFNCKDHELEIMNLMSTIHEAH